MSDEFEMSKEERQELLIEFLGESEGHLETLNNKLLQAETAIKENVEMSDADLDSMFRAAHTIKGMASFLDLKKVVGLTHELETILQRVKKREMALTEELVDVLFMGLDKLQELVTDLTETSEESADIEECMTKVKQILEGESSDAASKKEKDSEQECPQVENSSKQSKKEITSQKRIEKTKNLDINRKYLSAYIVDTEQNIEAFNEGLVSLEKEDDSEMINNLFRVIHTIKGSSGMINVEAVQSVAHSMENILGVVRESGKSFPDMFTLLFRGIDSINEIVSSLKEDEAVILDIGPILEKLEKYFNKCIGKQLEDVVQVKSGEAEEDLLEFVLQNAQQKELLTECVMKENIIYQMMVTIDEDIPMKSMKLALLEERLKDKGMIILMIPNSETMDDSIMEVVRVGIILGSMFEEDQVCSCVTIDGVDIVSVIHIDSQKIKTILQNSESVQSQGVSSEPETFQGTQIIQVSEEALELEKAKEQVVELRAEEESVRIESAGKMVEESVKKEEAVSESKKGESLQISTIRIDTNKLDSLMNLSGELVTVRAQLEQLVDLVNNEVLSQKEVTRDMSGIVSDYEELFRVSKSYLSQGMVSGKGKEESEETKKVAKLLDGFKTNLQALNHSMKGDLSSRAHSLDEITGSLGKIASDIQAGIMQTRMVPIEGVFTRFKRIVRDVSKSIGKQVNLIIEGEDTELDKKLVDSLSDPLTHMIRNAVDHGIEDPQVRIQSGKSEKGTIQLKASHRGNNICIEVGDDGKGLDFEKLVQNVLKKGLLTEEQTAQLTEREKLNLVFLPGFSTAAKVTGLSGRGVGMDVVKNMIEEVNGIVEIETEIGKGTTFVLKIPLTLAIIQALLVVIGEEIFAIPIESVTEIIKVAVGEIYSIDGNDTIRLREHALSLVSLDNVIGVGSGKNEGSKTKRVVVITDGEGKVGVVVDSLIGESEIVIKSLSSHFADVKGVSGATILGDGKISLIIDPTAIILESR